MGQLYHIISKEDLERVEELLRLMVVDVKWVDFKWRTAVNDTILSKKFSTLENTFTILSLKKTFSFAENSFLTLQISTQDKYR